MENNLNFLEDLEFQKEMANELKEMNELMKSIGYGKGLEMQSLEANLKITSDKIESDIKEEKLRKLLEL